jgi:hypothetical protein
MGGPGASVVGRPVAPTTGSAQVVCPRSCQLLGFYAMATGAITIYDANQTTTLPAALMTLTACAVGWNPLPVDFTVGIVANCAGATAAIFVFA